MLRRLTWTLWMWPALAWAQGEDFECSPAVSGLTQVWTESNRCIPISFGRAGALVRQRTAVVEAAFRRWQNVGCSDVEFQFEGESTATVGFDPSRDDNENLVLSTEDAEMVAMFGESGLLAVTLTSFSTATGEIFDADIVVNDALFDFERVLSVEQCLEQDEVFDLENTLTHEVGHLLGFAHNDDEASTMFGSSPACEVAKRTLEALDVQGLCQVYPSGSDSRACRRPSSYEVGSTDAFRDQCGGGCSCRSQGPSDVAPWVLLGVGLAYRRRRRRLSER